MKRSIKYLVAVCIVFVCVYGFRAWLQYKWATVIKQTTASIMTELTTTGKLETVQKSFTKTIEWEQQIISLVPEITVDDIVTSALFKDKMILTVTWVVSAGYTLENITTGNVEVSRDGTVTITLGAPKIFWVELTGATQTTKLGIVTQKDIDMENKLREKAGDMMIQEALSGNILEEAKTNAQSALQNLFLNAGIQIKEVNIKGTGDLQ